MRLNKIAVLTLIIMAVSFMTASANPKVGMSDKYKTDAKGKLNTEEANAIYGVSKNFYSNSKASGSGGIKGTIIQPAKEVLTILAVTSSDFRKCYQASLSGKDNRTFHFSGLEPSKYQLVVCFKDGTGYEGQRLTRGENELTPADLKSIKDVIGKSEGFYDKKRIHRIEGTTGKKQGIARAFTTYIRTKNTIDMGGNDYGTPLRMIALCELHDVGPGWQCTDIRQHYKRFFDLKDALKPFEYNKNISSIRVSSSVKDIGNIDLTVKE